MNGVVLYEGPSRIDGKPIVAIATGLTKKSSNPKTGAMVQTWILRQNVNPTEALKTGADASICGGCPHRPQRDGKGRTCYVNIMGPNAIYKTYQRGGYGRAWSAATFAGRHVRLGAYGDPAAVPMDVWYSVTQNAAGWTGYTHQWRSPRLRDVLELCQLSADSCEDAEAAAAAGIGYFRVADPSEPLLPGEFVCPASAEAGKTKTCIECKACTGFNGGRVRINAHGNGAKHFGAKRRRSVTLPVMNERRVAA